MCQGGECAAGIFPLRVFFNNPSSVGFDPALAALEGHGKIAYSGKPRDGAIQSLLGPRHSAHSARN